MARPDSRTTPDTAFGAPAVVVVLAAMALLLAIAVGLVVYPPFSGLWRVIQADPEAM